MAEYMETAVLVEVMNDDYDAARDRLQEFLPNELRTLQSQLRALDGLIGAELRRRRRGGDLS